MRVSLMHELFRGPRTYALVDAARDERIYPALVRADCDWLCLYRGDAATRMAEVAPYLVQLEPLSLFTAYLLDEGWGNSWGVFLNAALPLERIQAHFRRFILAHLPNGRTAYFRFYDPRVLRVYLPSCTDEERQTFFGPVERFVMEPAEGDAPLVFRP